MIVLGVIGFGENPAACLLKDGKLIALAEEERFTRLIRKRRNVSSKGSGLLSVIG